MSENIRMFVFCVRDSFQVILELNKCIQLSAFKKRWYFWVIFGWGNCQQEGVIKRALVMVHCCQLSALSSLSFQGSLRLDEMTVNSVSLRDG